MRSIELGKSAAYPDQYDAALLAPIPRLNARNNLPIRQYHENQEFCGRDLWAAFELSWLNPRGVPQVAIAEFVFDAASDNIIESKSFKYYLNSFNQSCFDSWQQVQEILSRDLSVASGGEVDVHLRSLDEGEPGLDSLPGRCVDHLDCTIEQYQPSADLLVFEDERVEQDALYSHLLKSNCPVTGQPDWATLWLCYSGPKLNEESFLKYIVGFRQYQGFHESCVERIYRDLMNATELTQLRVFARYTRRGGLDINPFRYSPDCNESATFPFGRLIRQ